MRITEKVSFNISSEVWKMPTTANLTNFWKHKAFGQKVLPDKSILIEQCEIKNSNETFWIIFKQRECDLEILRLGFKLFDQFGLFTDPDGELLKLFIFLLKYHCRSIFFRCGDFLLQFDVPFEDIRTNSWLKSKERFLWNRN